MDLTYFKQLDFYQALQRFFAELNIPVNYLTSAPATAPDILTSTYNPHNPAHQLMQDVYLLGGVDDAVFHQSAAQLDAAQLKQRQYEGLLIFGVTLNSNGNPPTRTRMAEIARAFNREFHYTPVVVVLQYDGLLSFASCERLPYRQTWREGEKVGKVSILKDVNPARPHTGHLKILEGLKIQRAGRQAIASFEALYKHWQTVFSVALLNKRFYQELANWYFWALSQVEFPDDEEKDKEVRNAVSVIRLITRLIFVWFLKEKHLIPETLFDPAALKDYLKYDDCTGSTYYKAILQNLFFATLNTEMRKDNPHSRKFVHRQYGVPGFYRYSRFFHDPERALELFQDIPFLNGGLFECLDKNAGMPEAVRVDCFSDRPANEPRLKVPDELFFGAEQEVDLSRVYGDAKRRRETVRGLISILNAYKFTIAENTPIEEEIALDPELLGKVFENLLASYNPETQTTARKQTGSFYTPREIVNYMVDESLLAYLANYLTGGEVEARLRRLLAYTAEPHQFSEAEVTALINALHNAKILDPACGSGAFPMGMLHKMAHLLSKLDPDNVRWRETQRRHALKETEQAFSLGDKEERDRRLLEINAVFEENASDYGRKLYLIENGIYGVDIQPIAVQIAKLRFFISLIVDQQVNPGKKNLGLLPLPNLETKFVAANTLIGVAKPQQMTLRSPEIDKQEAELRQVRQRHFDARTPQTKAKYRQADARLRQELAQLLRKDGFPADTTAQLAHWNPYDQNACAPFFDPEWMFGLQAGFDIVIGNPPYGATFNAIENALFKTTFKSFAYRVESYILFVEKGISLLCKRGHLCYIMPDTYLNLNFTKPLRQVILETSNLKEVVVLPAKVFSSATVNTTILLIGKQNSNDIVQKVRIKLFDKNIPFTAMDKYKISFDSDPIVWKELAFFNVLSNEEEMKLLIKLNRYQKLEKLVNIFYGIKAYQIGKGNPPQTKEIRDTKPFTAKLRKDDSFFPFYEGKHIDRYRLLWNNNNWVKYGPWLAEPRTPEKYEGEKILIRKIVGERLIAMYVSETSYCNTLLFVVKLKKNTSFHYKELLGILNSKLIAWYFRQRYQISSDDIFPQIMINDILQFPMPVSENPQLCFKINEEVDQILAAKQRSPAAGTRALEAEIDRQVYALYGLTAEEIAIVEGGK